MTTSEAKELIRLYELFKQAWEACRHSALLPPRYRGGPDDWVEFSQTFQGYWETVLMSEVVNFLGIENENNIKKEE